MPPLGPRLGVHLPLGGGLLRAAERAGEIGATAIQVFADNPTAWRRRASAPRKLPAFRARVAELGVETIAIHASYLVNLAGPERRFRRDSIAVLASELVAARAFGATLVNVHTGSHRDTGVKAGIRRVADGIVEALERADAAEGPTEGGGGLGSGERPTLVLENASGGGWSIGSSIEELERVAEGAAARGVPEARLGFCLDTAHAWGAGYRMDAPESIDRLLDTVDRALGLARLVMVHLNDSRSEAGSRTDRHEHIGGGLIGARGLGHLLRHPAVRHATFILETPGMDEGYDAVNLRRARALLAGEALEPLPPEAFQLAPRRSRGAAPPEDAALPDDGGGAEGAAPPDDAVA
ncbi:MAG: deoxyribonuclease IV [Chloroflexota bacterium]